MKILVYLSFLLFASSTVFSQSGSFGFKQLTEQQREMTSTFCLPNQEVYLRAIKANNWSIHSSNNQWVYFTATANELNKAFLSGNLPDFYIEYAPPALLNDSMRAHHKVDAVHLGQGLSSSYKGKDVIIGLVDTGIELNHPDFQKPDGKTRVLRIWDHSTNTGSTPSPYGYGIVWTENQINQGICTHSDDAAHGSTVAGAAAGNGRSVGYNHGVAPEADIIMIKTNFNLPNWTLTVADACEYVFKVADSLGKKAVINLSVGSYLGSHDGKDAAGIRMDQLLDEKPGRIIVGAAGNSGNMGKYHCHGDITADTSFVWFRNNSNSAFGPNKVFFDLYSDMSQANYSFSIKAINPFNNYETRAALIFRPALNSLGVEVFDTLRNANGDRIATVEIYREQEGDNFHMQLLISNVDSTNFFYGFYTVGSGSYDLWSGTGLGFNNMVETLPTPAQFPAIVHYNLPDDQQTIVSSWNCSPKVVSVANILNRDRFYNRAGGEYIIPGNPIVGQLSANSSKGPNRNNVIKPDVAASGDVMLSCGPLWYLQDPNNYPKMDVGGWHLGNGGTSMASPVVAGAAALFLERCGNGTYADFIELLKTQSTSNAYSGVLPNNAYGHGILDVFNIISRQEFTVNMAGDSILCQGPSLFEVTASDTISSVIWSNGTHDTINYQYTAGNVYATVYNKYGCGVQTDTIHVVQTSLETIDPITVSTDFLTLSTQSSNNTYQWTHNGVDIPGETNNTLVLTSITDGMYDCYTFDPDTNCKVYAGGVGIYLNIQAISAQAPVIYPNPANSFIFIQSEQAILAVQLVDLSGKELTISLNDNMLNIEHLAEGYYVLTIQTEAGTFQKSVIKKR